MDTFLIVGFIILWIVVIAEAGFMLYIIKSLNDFIEVIESTNDK
ncbi:hypothetical protein P4U03_26780 [Bacillus mycoides]|nr:MULTISPECIES: hypothetical protein [Bacillus]EEL46217.1 hypothetical protein bcere0021_16980 [Bacillus cereus Rock3-42]KKC57522.1 hypothetical protein OA45_01158 [Bacillus sp. UMTAT18]MDA1526858.1 hypothetical protein [Bacillus cereus group sp. TH260-2LC]MDG1623111.1 hypothetical protein [Bacillus mobilis]MDU2389944.1 hypothetical protein [Bacillus sp. (in: firmicutes)]